MSQTTEELEQIIKEAQDKISAIQEDERLEAEAQEIYNQTKARGQYDGSRIAASIKRACELLEEPIILPEEIPIPPVPKFTVDKTAFNHVVTQISTLVEEATFEINREGVSFRSMDPSHVALIDVRLPKECFTTFEENIEPSKFGVRIDELAKVLRNFDRKETLTIYIGEDSMLHIEGTSFKTTLRLIESSVTNCPLPNLNFDANIELDINTIKKLKGIQTVSEYICFELVGNKFVVSGKGDSGEAELIVENFKDLRDNIATESKATYSLDYLVKVWNNIIRDIKGSVRFDYSTKMPAKLSYNVLGYGKVDFYLAPRVQD